MGYAYEDYCEAVYEREYCMSDIDFSCDECAKKDRELEECYDGYHLFRNNLEPILDLLIAHSNGINVNFSDISLNVFRMCKEAGVDYEKKLQLARII